MYIEIGIVSTLIGINGFLAMSELAMVSSRRARLQSMSAAGSRGASAALQVIAKPGRFLSTVQIGITMVGIGAGAFSGATIAGRLDTHLRALGLSAAAAEFLAYGIVVTIITYFSVVAGELVPKQIALRHAERVAASVAIPMRMLTRLFAPLVSVLDASARISLKVMGHEGEVKHSVTDEEIKALIGEAERAGVVEPEERSMIAGVMRLADRPVRAIMTQRMEVEWIDLLEDEASIRRRIKESSHACLPAARGALDDVVGVVSTKDLLDSYLDERPVHIQEMVHSAPAVNDSINSLDVIDTLREAHAPMVLVIDEHGSFEGIVTKGDILKTIAGEIGGMRGSEPAAVERSDGSLLIDGAMPADMFAELLGVSLPPGRTYHTVAGFILDNLRRFPAVGETFQSGEWRFEIADLDGLRIDKIIATRNPPMHRKLQ
jgi:putative hemolysin